METVAIDSTHHLLATIWFLIIGLFMVIYVVLDGFDLGVGVLSLFVGDEPRRAAMMSSLGSIWDANETWLVVIGGTLFGAFPLVYGTVLHGLYIPVIVMLRGVSFEFHELSTNKPIWSFTFGLGSLVAAVAQGFALGGLLNGVAVVNGHFVGGAMDWLSPFSVFVALGVVAGYAMLGSTYLIMKSRGMMQDACFERGHLLALAMIVTAAVVTVWTPMQYPQIYTRWFSVPNVYYFALLPLAAFSSFVMLLRALKKRYEVAPFVWTTLIFLFSFIGLAATWFPYIIPGYVTIDQAAAPNNTLVFMLVGIGMLIPVMMTYNIYQYVVFRGKVDPDHAHMY